MQLPPNTRPSRVDYPGVRRDFCEILQINAHRICVSIGIPSELMIRNHPIRVDPEQTAESLKARALEIQKLLQPILTAALRACTKANDFAMRVVTQDERYSTEPVIFFAQEGPKTDELVKLYEKNLLPRKFIERHLAEKYRFEVTEYDGNGGEPDAEAVGAPQE